MRIGIIAEYNPFHNGHIYHIEEIKRRYPNSSIVLVMSGNFTQRGLVSTIDKWDKTFLALKYGIDLVVELPFPFATQSADIFARGAIFLLKELKVDKLIFGSEGNNKDKLYYLAQKQLDHSYNEKVQSYLKMGKNYPTAMNEALKDLANDEITSPNDLLGLSYVKEIIRQNASIEVETIKRTNSYHDETLQKNISSATSIRKHLFEKKSIKGQVPKEALEILENRVFLQDDYFKLLKYQIYASDDLSKYLGVDEGIENKILKIIDSATTFDDLIKKTKSKRYTYNRTLRMYNHILCGFTKEMASNYQMPEYIRVLGFSDVGKNILKQERKNTSVPIITKFNSREDGLLLEKKVTSIYASILSGKKMEELIKKEYQQSPVEMKKTEVLNSCIKQIDN